MSGSVSFFVTHHFINFLRNFFHYCFSFGQILWCPPLLPPKGCSSSGISLACPTKSNDVNNEFSLFCSILIFLECPAYYLQRNWCSVLSGVLLDPFLFEEKFTVSFYSFCWLLLEPFFGLSSSAFYIGFVRTYALFSFHLRHDLSFWKKPSFFLITSLTFPFLTSVVPWPCASHVHKQLLFFL